MDLNQGEVRLIDFQHQRTGSFFTHLFEALFVADGPNREKLAMGFPEEAEAVRKWQNVSGYAQIIEKAYEEFKH